MLRTLSFDREITPKEKYSGRGGGGGVLPHISYMGVCRYEGYGFQTV